ncbi:MAG: flagellin [Balneolaceae bacterium]
MRITQKTLFDSFMRDIQTNRRQMGKVQSDLSSGRRVRFASQGPVAFEQSRVIESNIRKEEQYQRNISSGLRQARLAQEAIDQGLDQLIEVKQIGIKGLSESSGPDVRENLARQVSGLRDNLVDTLNVSYGDRYLLAGTASDERPFEITGTGPGGVEMKGNGVAPKVAAGDGVSVEISIDTDSLRGTPGGDLFEILSGAEQALNDNDTDALRLRMEEVDQAIDHIADLGSRLGTRVNQLDHLYETYSSSTILQESDVSELVDTDYAESFSELQRIQIAYESAMAVHSSMTKVTLLDFI